MGGTCFLRDTAAGAPLFRYVGAIDAAEMLLGLSSRRRAWFCDHAVAHPANPALGGLPQCSDEKGWWAGDPDGTRRTIITRECFLWLWLTDLQIPEGGRYPCRPGYSVVRGKSTPHWSKSPLTSQRFFRWRSGLFISARYQPNMS